MLNYKLKLTVKIEIIHTAKKLRLMFVYKVKASFRYICILLYIFLKI